jgi:hypothetical protein
MFFFVTRTLSLDVEDVYSVDEVIIRAIPTVDAPISAKIYDAQSAALAQALTLAPENDVYVARTQPPPGAYRAKVTAAFPLNAITVTEAFLTVG